MQPEANENTSSTKTNKLRYKPPQEDTEYNVDRIVRQISKGKDVKYVVRWCEFGPSDDAEKPSKNAPQQFTARYWEKFLKNW